MASHRPSAANSGRPWPGGCAWWPKGASTPFGTAPRTKGYTIKAIFEIGMTEFDSTFVFMPLAESQAFFNKEVAVIGEAVKAAKIEPN